MDASRADNINGDWWFPHTIEECYGATKEMLPEPADFGLDGRYTWDQHTKDQSAELAVVSSQVKVHVLPVNRKCLPGRRGGRK